MDQHDAPAQSPRAHYRAAEIVLADANRRVNEPEVVTHLLLAGVVHALLALAPVKEEG